MAVSNELMDAVARFTDADVNAFRKEWNSQAVEKVESPQKQAIFEKVQKKLSGKNLIEGGLSVQVFVKYTSLSGELKQREIIIRRVFKTGKEILIDALCLDINSPRIIKLKNILQLVDIQTKTLYVHPEQFFEDVLGISLFQEKKEEQSIQKENKMPNMVSSFSKSLKNGQLKTALDRTRHEITVLSFISDMDGTRDTRELVKIIEYVHKRCPDLDFDDADLMHYLQINRLDVQSFYFSLERILGKEGWVVKMFLEKMLELIVADGIQTEKEKLFIADFLRILEEEGFELNFKNK
ncbi:MAG: hypothetical protein E7013_00370 [Alphaproteobacteria bacterium]|nr:hypothetical protein [Alphaproteobacteria bacterium]